MEDSDLSSPVAVDSPEDPLPPSSSLADTRKSRRAVRKPELFSQGSYSVNDTSNITAKRKRAAAHDEDHEDEEDQEVNDDNGGEGGGDDDDDDEDALSESEDEEEEGEAYVVEVKKKQHAARKRSKRNSPTGSQTKAKRPAAKKPRVARNGASKSLAFRPLTNGKLATSRLRKAPARFSFAAGTTGLYAEVFSKGQTVDATAAEWLTRYQNNKVSAMCEMVNFILRCSGTELQVETQNIEDVDHIPSCITDLQQEYQEQGISEYPLISKSKHLRAFPSVLQNFFIAFAQTLHHASVLYNDEDLFENIQIWVSGLSTSGCRPFRHTATFISLTLTTALCAVAREVTNTVSTSRKQLEAEKKKKAVNKGRSGAILSAIKEGEKKLETIDALLKDSFDTVFVHRYRDVDARIRAECMAALGQWIRDYREVFFEGQYLRYFGWVLSDTSAHTRSVVIEQLRSLFENRDNLAALRSFTERFRSRMVEMAAYDADVSVRASTVELLELVRDAGLIEPSDIDTVGRLVFDAEPRVRQAAGRFFVAIVNDVFESTTDEVSEELNEIFADDDEDDFVSPKRTWIKFRYLVDTLQTYDEQESEARSGSFAAVTSRDVLSGSSLDSRFILATEAIYPFFEELAQWQSLAGYLLYDHSQIPDDPAEDDLSGTIKNLYKIQEGQEVILLEVLYCAVKLRILEVAKMDVHKRGRKAKSLADKIPELQEEIAHSLAQIVPQLLNRFGAVPEAASVVLRLEHLVDLDKIHDLQKDAAAYSSLLTDINKQFMTHSDLDVLAEASIAFIHAKSSDEMKEAMESKIQELWDDVSDALTTLSEQATAAKESAGSSASPGALPAGSAIELVHTIIRISNLASVTDCTSNLESLPSSSASKRKRSKMVTPFDILLQLAKRGVSHQNTVDYGIAQETELVVGSFRTLLFYFMWKVQGVRAALESGKAAFNTAFFEALSKRRESFANTLVATMAERTGLDEMRFAAAITFLDLQTLFGTLRHVGQPAKTSEDVLLQVARLVQGIDSSAMALIAKIHGVAERTYAKKIGRPLEPEDDDAPASGSEDDENSSNGESEGEAADRTRLRSTLVAEQRLCELSGKIVLAIVGRVINTSGPQSQSGEQLKQKLLKNRLRLGPNYREVVSYLMDRQPPSKSASKAKAAAAQRSQQHPSNISGRGRVKATENVGAGGESDEDELESNGDVEEDGDDDLVARELVDDPIVDEDEQGLAEAAAAIDPDGKQRRLTQDSEDEIMGD